MRGAAAAVAALALAVGIAACGGSGNDAATTAIQAPAMTGEVPTTTTEQPGITAKDNSVTVTTTPTATTGTPPTGTRTATTPSGESGAGGAGDEEAIRTPVALTARDGALSPTTVTIPAFLALTVTVSTTDRSQIVRINAPGGGDEVVIPPHSRFSRSLTGLRPGDYTVTTRYGGRTVLHVVNGGDPGP